MTSPAVGSSGIFIVLPVFNEEEALAPLLGRIESLVQAGLAVRRIIVVDDGSQDQSVPVAYAFGSRIPIEIKLHETNQGLGRTIQDGLLYAASIAAPADVIITMDADNTHPPEVIPEMLSRLEGRVGVVIASRYCEQSRVEGLGRFRRLMTSGARLLFGCVLPIRGVRDYTCGFRAYRAAVLQATIQEKSGILSSERGFASMAEILLNVAATGTEISEVPFVLCYHLKGGSSKMNVPQTVIRIVRLVLKRKWAAVNAGRR